MATKKAPKKFVEKKDVKTEQQLMIQAAINSSYSLLIPCVDCKFMYVRNPITGQLKHFETNKKEFVSFVKELTALGLAEKVEKDFIDLSEKNDHWTKVLNYLKSQEAL